MATGDRNNYSGEFSFTAPSGGVTKGKLYQFGSGLIVVARQTADAAATFIGATEVLVQLFGPRPDRVTIGTGGLAAVTGTPDESDNKVAIMRTVKDFRTVMSKLGMAVAAT